jgi:hypothetical protein
VPEKFQKSQRQAAPHEFEAAGLVTEEGPREVELVVGVHAQAGAAARAVPPMV